EREVPRMDSSGSGFVSENRLAILSPGSRVCVRLSAGSQTIRRACPHGRCRRACQLHSEIRKRKHFFLTRDVPEPIDSRLLGRFEPRPRSELVYRLRSARQHTNARFGRGEALPGDQHAFEPGTRQTAGLAAAESGELYGYKAALWKHSRGVPTVRALWRPRFERDLARNGHGHLRSGRQSQHGLSFVASRNVPNDAVQRAAGMVAGKSRLSRRRIVARARAKIGPAVVGLGSLWPDE